jgi:hypothetical protein
MTIHVEVNSNNPLDAIRTKMAIEKISKNFNTKNLEKIAELSAITDANTKIEKLFNNPFFKMAL